MLSIGAVASAGAASAYFSKDDYYTRDADGPSAWAGAGAEALGLAGPVQRADFAAVLDGKLPGQAERLGFEAKGVWKHRAGWDLTFSAPKSVSVMAQVAGDLRLATAHDQAVRATLAAVEREHAGTRIKEAGVHRHETTGNLVIALFRHELNRNRDPQLHTHAVVANATETARGWRSLDDKRLYDAKMEIGLRYRQELALRVQQLGYNIDIKPNGTFEIRGVSRETMAAFSTRRTEIEAKLEALGIEPGEASAKESAAATLSTRRSKGAVDHDAVYEGWRIRITPAALGAIEGLHAEARGRTAAFSALLTIEARTQDATDILRVAIDALSEREAAFSTERLLAVAGKIAIGRATDEDLKTALQAAVARGDALGRQVVEADRQTRVDQEKAGVTTEKLRAMERAMIAAEAAGRGSVTRLASPGIAAHVVDIAEKRSARHGHAWTDDQRAATATLLTSRNAVVAVQGLAGTAKTSTVLASFADYAERSGYNVRALAPTASAAETLGEALRLTGKTVDRHLQEARAAAKNAPQTQVGGARKIWIVDEASMLSTAKLRALIETAEREKARLVLVGDVRQLGSVEAGAGFRQLQEAGMQTAVLERIVRQTNDALRLSVEQAAAGRAAISMRYFDPAKDNLIVADTADERRTALADRWLALSPQDRSNTILIDPSREGRAKITDAVRKGLIAEGALGLSALTAARLETKGLTVAEKRFVFSYEVGDQVRFARGYRLSGVSVAAGAYLTVVGTRQGDGVVELRTPGGAVVDWKPAEKGAAKAEIFSRETAELRAGDAVVWTRNDPSLGLRNGQTGRVSVVDIGARQAIIAFSGGGEKTIDVDDLRRGHWRHGYAQTAYAAQGRTAERVLIHAESARINLVNASSFYVALSRAKDSGVLATDDPDKLRAGLEGRAGAKMTALETEETRRVAAETDARGLSTQARLGEAVSEAVRALRQRVYTPRRTLPSPADLFRRDPAIARDAGAHRGDTHRVGDPEKERDKDRETKRARAPETMQELAEHVERRRLENERANKIQTPSRGFER
ncbi:MobF family relaxase [Rubrimonas cliftonensis]|uniref:Conjugative relaxase domain-containing protein, TrwC/TraI family n=1 Tax=Rubrimonas cliftonensis TaxID=89524 RepID=A0A1H4ESH0_9RHOB|nr:MobF family relaxase [Rubrimonas cliftonensis]SEA87981.1 conjugative relaxase domain-containing protein, TrwC/TraI family [Rubrimonas cliftonensis]